MIIQEARDLPIIGSCVEPILLKGVIPETSRKAWWRHVQKRSQEEQVQMRIGRTTDEEVMETMELRQALSLFESASTSSAPPALLLESLGSSCSMDQLPIYDVFSDCFAEPDVWYQCSQYTPVSESLSIPGYGAISLLSLRFLTRICLHLGGGSVDWSIVPQTEKQRRSESTFPETEALARTWTGSAFGIGFNSRSRLRSSDNLLVEETTSEAGDVIVIPPHWWLQYSADSAPGVLVHSQRCSSLELPQLVDEIQQGKPTITKSEEPRTLIKSMFDSIDGFRS